MSPTAPDQTEDRFLAGQLRIRQPRVGYRAATDPVLLAAATPIEPGQSVLDLGCGVGTAGLCLAARVPLSLTGLELQPAYAALARENAALNGISARIVVGDLGQMPTELKQMNFDHVITNPPYHDISAIPSPSRERDAAHREALPLADWLNAALARVRPKGWLTLIHRADRLDDILAALDGAGDIAIKPLTARAGRDAKRVLIRARKGVRSPLRLCSPLVLHDGAAHTADREDFTPHARDILRGAATIEF